VAAEKGVIDGFIRPSELLISRKLYEVAKYVTISTWSTISSMSS